MSLWVRRRDADGNVHHYAIPFDPLASIAIVGIAVGFSLPIFSAICKLVLSHPDQTAFASAVGLAIRLAMFTIAKLSVIRSTTLMSVGPARMTRPMRLMFFGGYVTMAVAITLALLLLATP